MQGTTQQTLSRALLTLLRPLVRILLRNGVAYGSFAELAKQVYVDVAFDEFMPPGRKPSISRVSALTGLTRKEARRLHERDRELAAGNEQRYNRAVRVISGWVNDPQFHDPQGKPAELPIEGSDASFAALVKKYSGDVPTQSMLAVLSTAGSVARADDQVQLIQHAYVPGNDDADKLNIMGSDTAELIATIDHNLVSAADARRFQRKVSNHRVRAEALDAFQTLATDKSQALLEELDAWLSRNEVNAGNDTEEQGRYVSLGIYYFEPTQDEEDRS
jgi:hypothetical protein